MQCLPGSDANPVLPLTASSGDAVLTDLQREILSLIIKDIETHIPAFVGNKSKQQTKSSLGNSSQSSPSPPSSIPEIRLDTRGTGLDEEALEELLAASSPSPVPVSSGGAAASSWLRPPLSTNSQHQVWPSRRIKEEEHASFLRHEICCYRMLALLYRASSSSSVRRHLAQSGLKCMLGAFLYGSTRIRRVRYYHSVSSRVISYIFFLVVKHSDVAGYPAPPDPRESRAGVASCVLYRGK